MQKNIAIVVAGGSGQRFGADRPKQFLKLKDREILAYSVETFQRNAVIARVIIVVSQDNLNAVAERYPEAQVVAGGTTRQASVIAGLDACDPDTDNVCIHDAARPLVTARIVQDCLAALEHSDGVAPVLLPADSMVQLDQEGFTRLDRDSLRLVQTPQCFPYSVIKSALNSGADETDEIGLLQRVNPHARITFIPGESSNLKITRGHDLAIAATYLEIGPETV